MTRIVWSAPEIQSGLDRGVIYPPISPGVEWNGLISVEERPTTSDEQVRHLDGVKIQNRKVRGEFSGSIEAYTYPDALYENIFIQKMLRSFGLSYRITAEDNYRLHLVYNVVIVPSKRTYQQRDPSTFQWEFSTLPIDMPFANRSAHLILDTSVAYSWVISEIEDILYGTASTDPRLPTPEEVWDIVEAGSIVLVTDHGDGTFTVTGPDDVITMLSATTFEITWPSVINIDADTYQISSL